MAITVEYGEATKTIGRITADGSQGYLFEGDAAMLRRFIENSEFEYGLTGQPLIEKLLTQHRQRTWMRRIT